MFKKFFKRITTLFLCAFFLFSCVSCELCFVGKKPLEETPSDVSGEVKVYFDGNGATEGSMSAMIFAVGENVTLPANAFIKQGEVFAGWALEKTGEVVYEDQDTYVREQAGEYTLFAVWEEGIELKYELTAGEYTLTGYKGQARKVSVPAVYNGHPVVSIGGEAFNNATFLREIVVEEGVLSVSDQAFAGCLNLEKINLPESLLSISAGAIEDTAYYKNENNWDSGVLYVGNHLLKATSDLSGFYTVKEGTRSINARAFTEAENLSGISIPQTVVSFERSALDGTAFYNDKNNWDNNVLYVGDYLIKAQPGLFGSYTVKEGTKRIAMGAFSGCRTLEKIALPTSLEIAGASAFASCGIREVQFEDGLTSLGRKAFINCDRLSSVVLPSTLRFIDTSAFSGCASLENLSLPSELTEIGPGAFRGCAFAEIELPQGITRIEAETFSSCPLSHIELSEKITHVGHSAFYNTALTEIEIPSGVKTVGAYAFSFNASLQTAIIGEGLNSLGAGAFYSCQNLQTVAFGGQWNKTGSFAFGGCARLTEINVAEENSVYKSVDGDLYSKDGKILIQYAVGKADVGFVLPVGVEEIARQAFEGATALQNVTFNAELKKIGNYAFARSGLTEVVVPDCVEEIGLQAFNGCSALARAKIGDGVTEIVEGVFLGCSSLVEIALGSGVTKMVSSAFNDTENLTKITVAEENPTYKSVEGDLYSKDGKKLIKYAVGKKQNAFLLPEGVTHVSDYAFCGAKNLAFVELSSTVLEIGENAFRDCGKLSEIALNNALEKIGDYAFYKSGLTNVTLGEKVTVIGAYAFFYCEKLSSITLSESVTTVGDWAFGWCRNLLEIIIPQTVASLGERVFYFCFDLTVYCQAEAKPDGWSKDWNVSNCNVVWDY